MSTQSSHVDGGQQIQNPLTLVMPIKSEELGQQLRMVLEQDQATRDRIEAALNELKTVHFARFVLLERDTRLAVITTYDDDFDDYIMDFIDELGEVFDELLEFIDEAPPRPVQEHRDEFLAYVKAHDLRCVGSFYSAYPELPVNDIVAGQPSGGG